MIEKLILNVEESALVTCAIEAMLTVLDGDTEAQKYCRTLCEGILERIRLAENNVQ